LALEQVQVEGVGCKLMKLVMVLDMNNQALMLLSMAQDELQPVEKNLFKL
jgi:hypothetical protein